MNCFFPLIRLRCCYHERFNEAISELVPEWRTEAENLAKIPMG